MLKEDFFENSNISDDEKANASFQIVAAMRDAINLALKGPYMPTYEKSLAYIKDVSPDLYESIIKYLPGKNESELTKRFKEKAEADPEEGTTLEDRAVSFIREEIDACDATIHKSMNNKASKGYKRQLREALKSFQTREYTEHQLLSHDFHIVTRSDFKAIEGVEVDRRDYILPSGKRLRIYLAHPDKIEHVLGVDMIYEAYDMHYKLARFAHLQYKTWKNQTLTFDPRELRQLERLKTHNCTANTCRIPPALASANEYRFPYCSAFVRPTNKIVSKGSRMISMGDHIPLCKLIELKSSGKELYKYLVQDISISQTVFEEAFSKYHVGSGWMPIGDLEEYYKKRNLSDLESNVRIFAQEIDFKDDEPAV